MNTLGTSDLAQAQFMRNHNVSIKQNIQKYTSELATGQIADVRDALAGNYSFLTDVERKTEVLGSYDIANAEAGHFTSSMQLALGHIGDIASTLSGSLIAAGTSSTAAGITNAAGEANATFETIVNTLNTEIAGRYLFSGNATNQQPLVDADTIMDGLRAAIAGATTPQDMLSQATTWFDDPAGFTALAYQGGDEPLSPFVLSPSESASVDLRATDPDLMGVLRNAAVSALADDPAFGLDADAQADLFNLAGQEMLLGQDNIVRLQARVGFAEARVEAVTARNAAEITSLSMARNALLEADPYEAATKLEEAQFQLQSLYSVTVRMSQLSLVNYL